MYAIRSYYDTSLVEEGLDRRTDIDVLGIPASEMAVEVGDQRLVNMVMIGAYAQKSGVVSLDSLKESLKKVLPERNHRLIPLNVQAIDAGAAYVLQNA